MRLGLPLVSAKSAIVLTVTAYVAGYLVLPQRTTERVGSGKSELRYCRYFNKNWQVQLFRPAASLEYQLIRALPKPLATQDEEGVLSQTLQLQGPTLSRYYLR